MFNREKMKDTDWSICLGKLIDIGVGIACTLAMARISRIFLFRHEMMSLESVM